MQEVSSFTARIVASHGRMFFVKDANGTPFEATRKGKKTDAVVGDIVECLAPVAGKTSILRVMERKNRLFRSDMWREKTLAANLDTVAITFASRPTFNPWFVWKALVAAHAEGIRTVLIRTKNELRENAEAAELFTQSLEEIGEKVISLSALTEAEETRRILAKEFSGETVLLVGQSGMGKSTLLNTLSTEAKARTQEFSVALDNGKQTTTETRLYPIDIDGSRFEIIDSPGFQEFGLAHLTKTDVLEAMPDIAKFVSGCRFYNCTHTREPGCAVLEALKKGLIRKDRHDFYIWLLDQIDSKRNISA